MGRHRYAFLDKDGTLIDDVPYNVDPARMVLATGVEALGALRDAGFRFAVISNQSGVALARFDEGALVAVEERLRALLAAQDIALEAFLYCPHHPNGTVAAYARSCECRKPEPGLLRLAAARLDADLGRSWMIGDTLDDVEAGHRAGCRAALINNGGETEWTLSPARRPDAIGVDLAEVVQEVLAMETFAGLASAGSAANGR